MPAPEPRPWRGRVYRHIPAGSPFGLLDTHLAARSHENRWNVPGEPTLAFAGNHGGMADELSRHFQRDRDPALLSHLQDRRVFSLELRLQRVFDLTDPDVTRELGISDAPACFDDRALARATAGFLRHVRLADGIVTPSLAFPANASHWHVVVFLDRLSEPIEAAVSQVASVGILPIEGRETG